MDHVYLSNLWKSWPRERQEAVLASVVPEGSLATFEDRIEARERQGHMRSRLVARNAMLDSIEPGGVVWTASLAVLCWAGADLRALLDRISEAGARLEAPGDGFRFSGRVTPDVLDRAAAAHAAGRRGADRATAARHGAMASGRAAAAHSDARIALIAERWPLPNSEWSTRALLAECGVSLNTVVARLGRRGLAQASHMAQGGASASGARRKPRRSRAGAKRSRILAAMHETAVGMHRAGVMDDATMAEMDRLCAPAATTRQAT